MTGLFVSIEGTEGAGKSTNQRFAGELLSAHGEVLLTREPGGTVLGEEIRELLLKSRTEQFSFSPRAELLLMFAARTQHVEETIRPALLAGRHVVSDRFTDATYAYQGAARGLDQSLIALLEKQFIDGLKPDLTLFLKIDPAIGLARARARSQPDRFESEKLEFFERVQSAYLQRAHDEPERIVVIDAGQSLAAVQADIESAVKKALSAAETNGRRR